MRAFAAIVAVVVALSATAAECQAQDLIFLKDGTVMKGKVTGSDWKIVTIARETPEGPENLTIKAERCDPHFYYRVRDKALGNDAEGRIKLAVYAFENELYSRAKVQMRQAEAIDAKAVETFRKETLPPLLEGFAQQLMRSAQKAMRAGSTKNAKKYCSAILTKAPNTKAAVEAEKFLTEVEKKIDDAEEAKRNQRRKMAQAKEETAERMSASKRDGIVDPIEKVIDHGQRLNHSGLTSKNLTDAKRLFQEAGGKYKQALAWIDSALKTATAEETITDLNHLQAQAKSEGVSAYVNAANILSTRSDYQGALKMINLALAIDPESSEAKSLRAEVSTAGSGWGHRRGGRRR